MFFKENLEKCYRSRYFYRNKISCTIQKSFFSEKSKRNTERNAKQDGHVVFAHIFASFSRCLSRCLKETLNETFCTKGRHNNNMFAIAITSNKRILLKAASKVVEKVYRDNAVFNMSYDAFMCLCFNVKKEDLFSFLSIDPKRNMMKKIQIVMKTRTPTLMNPPNTNLLQLWSCEGCFATLFRLSENFILQLKKRRSREIEESGLIRKADLTFEVAKQAKKEQKFQFGSKKLIEPLWPGSLWRWSKYENSNSVDRRRSY